MNRTQNIQKSLFVKTIVVLIAVILSACVSNQSGTMNDNMANMHDMNGMHNMPCHQMPNGEWMGDCSKENNNEESSSQGESLEGVPFAKEFEVLDVKNGERIAISADIVKKEIAGKVVRMYGYNGMIPGLALKVDQKSTITVDFTNNIDMETTVHWHGLRHDIKDDGVPDISQKVVMPGETYTYTVTFPDAGLYWYHPHVREDIQQESGLSGVMISSVDGEVLVLDDILLDQNGMAPFGEEYATHAMMGRYGNVMLINGDDKYKEEVVQGSVMRYLLVNTANARPFDVRFDGAKMKLVGSDLGMYEHEEYVDSLIIAPAERYIVDVFFDEENTVHLMSKERVLGTFIVKKGVQELTQEQKEKNAQMFELKENTAVVEEIASFSKYFDEEPKYILDLDFRMPSNPMMESHMQMMKEEMHEEGIEWEDTMASMNAHMTTQTIQWIIRDEDSKKEGMNLVLNAKVGDVMKIRLRNLDTSMHPMQHPIHLHGQRFLVLSKDGIEEQNKVWKDTVLIPAGSEVDILVDVTNPGDWMMHCHIAEHLEAGMMTMLHVEK